MGGGTQLAGIPLDSANIKVFIRFAICKQTHSARLYRKVTSHRRQGGKSEMSLNSEVLSNVSLEKSSDEQDNISGINVGGIERLACAITGGALTVYGFRKRSAGGLILTLAGAALLHRGGTGHCNTYQALGITTANRGDSNPRENNHDVARDVHVEKSIIIGKSPEELYSFWRDFENLPRFMDH